jgi:diadenylate cyclase
MTWLTILEFPGWRAWIEILIMSGLFYFFFLMFRGTRGAQVLTGLVMVLVALLALTQLVHLNTLNWMLRQFFIYAAVGVLIIFQPEIRRALAEIGRKPVLRSVSETRAMVDAVVDAVCDMAKMKTGALIAIEREIGTRSIQDTGIAIDSRVNAELLLSIFVLRTPLHDGGVILCGNRIGAAACLFPLSQRAEISRGLGTRHRAALGLSEETDALVVIVSEETGQVSICNRGVLTRGFDEDSLRRTLLNLLIHSDEPDSLWRRVVWQITLRWPGRSPEVVEGKDT